MKRSNLLLIGVTILLFGLVLTGAYTAVQLLAEPEAAQAAAGNGRVMESVRVADGGAAVSVRTTILPAAELPDEPATASGIVLARVDDTITLGTGAIDLDVDVEVDGATGLETVSVVPTTNGPQLEVVITRDTALYRDVTDVAGQIPSESGEVTLTQVVKAATGADAISEKMELEVWGSLRGDRIVADVIVFGPLAGGQFE